MISKTDSIILIYSIWHIRVKVYIKNEVHAFKRHRQSCPYSATGPLLCDAFSCLDSMRAAQAQHDDIAVSIVQEFSGYLVNSRREGDSIFADFPFECVLEEPE